MPTDEAEFNRCLGMGIDDPHKVLTMRDMIGSEDVIFAATGITPGDFLDGVMYLPGQRAETHSIVMRAKTKTIRFIKTNHYLPNKTLLINSEQRKEELVKVPV